MVMENIQKGTASLFHDHGKPYTSISNEAVDLLTNPDALAIWTFLQTRSSGWTVIGGFLQERFGMGRERYAKAMKILKEVGLISHQHVRCNETNAMLGRRVIVHHSPNLQVSEYSACRTYGKTTATNKGSNTNKGSKDTVSQHESCPEIISHLNKMAGTAYRAVDGTTRLITARLKEGATVDDMKRVIDAKCAEWKGTDMQKYLRPQTLFNATKFDQYLGALGDAKPTAPRHDLFANPGGPAPASIDFWE